MINKRDFDYMISSDFDDEGFELAREQWIQHQNKKARQAEQRAVEEAYRLQQQQAEEARIVKEKTEAFFCRRCSEKYSSNIKLHEHVRSKHCKKSKKSSSSSAVIIATSSTPPASPPLAPVAPVSPPQTPAAKPSEPASPASPPSASNAPITAPPTPGAIPSTPTEPPITPPAAATTPPATPIATPEKPISWAEIASRPKKPYTPSRLPRLTTKYGLPTSPPSPILQPQESTNHVAKRPSNTPSFAPPRKSYLTVEDLYTMFHGKPRPSSLPARQIRLPSAPPSGLRQARITAYFKPPTSNGPACHAPLPKAPLASNRKHAESKNHGQSIQNRDLAPSAPRSASFSLASADHPTHRTCRRCKQHFSSGNLLHRHLTHCSRGTFGYSGYSSPELRMKRGG